MIDRTTNRSRGFRLCYPQHSRGSASKAIDAMNGKDMGGRTPLRSMLRVPVKNAPLVVAVVAVVVEPWRWW